MIRTALLFLTLSCVWADDYMDALAKWIDVFPISPTVEWHKDQAALLALNRPGYTSAMGWMYTQDTATIYAFPCAEAAPSMRHEVFHAIAHSRLPPMPLWLNEGTAQMMERIRVVDGNLQFTTHNRIRTAARTDVTLQQIMAYTSSDFGGKDSHRTYCTSYAAALWMHQTGTLQDWLHGKQVPLDADAFRKWLSDPWAWP